MTTLERAIYGAALILTLWQLAAIRKDFLSHKWIMPIPLSILCLVFLSLVILTLFGASPLHLLWVVPVCLVLGTAFTVWPPYTRTVLGLICLGVRKGTAPSFHKGKAGQTKHSAAKDPDHRYPDESA